MNSEVTQSERALRWIGDLDHPFYNDERQRFIWYEASTIGFQLVLYVTLAALAAMAWIGGTGSLLYVWPMYLLLHFVVPIVVVGYAKQKYAEYTPSLRELLTPKHNLHLVLLAVLMAGLARAHWGLRTMAGDAPASGFFGGFVRGFSWGLVTIPVALAIGITIGIVMVFLEGSKPQVDEELGEI